MATMEKIFKCLSCQKDIRLERKPDNTGWNKFNLDGSAHIHEKKTAAVRSGPTSAQQQQLTAMSEQIKILITQVQLLRSEIKELKTKQ
jgi:hypothetical protein